MNALHVILLISALNAGVNLSALSLGDLNPAHIWHTITGTAENVAGTIEGIAVSSFQDLENQVDSIVGAKTQSSSQAVVNSFNTQQQQLNQQYQEKQLQLAQLEQQTASSFRSTFESQLQQGLNDLKSQLQNLGGNAMDLYQSMAASLILGLLSSSQLNYQITQYYCWTGCDPNTAPYQGPIQPFLAQFNLTNAQLAQAQQSVQQVYGLL